MVGKLATLLTEAGVDGPDALATALILSVKNPGMAERVAAKIEQDLTEQKKRGPSTDYRFDVV